MLRTLTQPLPKGEEKTAPRTDLIASRPASEAVSATPSVLSRFSGFTQHNRRFCFRNIQVPAWNFKVRPGNVEVLHRNVDVLTRNVEVRPLERKDLNLERRTF